MESLKQNRVVKLAGEAVLAFRSAIRRVEQLELISLDTETENSKLRSALEKAWLELHAMKCPKHSDKECLRQEYEKLSIKQEPEERAA